MSHVSHESNGWPAMGKGSADLLPALVLPFTSSTASAGIRTPIGNLMKPNMLRNLAILLGVAAGTVFAPGASAQQITGTPGSPGATTSIDGKQLPAPDLKFGGVITN